MDRSDREQRQQQLAAQLAQLPSINGHHKQQQEEPQIPQQPDDTEAIQAWQVHVGELKQLQQKGREGGWLIHHSEVRWSVSVSADGLWQALGCTAAARDVASLVTLASSCDFVLAVVALCLTVRVMGAVNQSVSPSKYIT